MTIEDKRNRKVGRVTVFGDEVDEVEELQKEVKLVYR